MSDWELSTFEKRFFRIIFLLFFIPTVSYILYGVFFHKQDWSWYYERKKEVNFEGVITDKYVNYKKRALNTIVLNEEYHYEIPGLWSEKFDIGDYVKKEKESLIICLIKPNNDTLLFDYTGIMIEKK